MVILRMAQPATTPTWATDATFTSGPKSGSNTKVTPSAGALAQGDVPGQPYRSERKNWLFYWTCQWIAYLKNLATDAFFLGQTYAWTAAHSFATDVTLTDNTKFVTYATPANRTSYLNMHKAVDGTGAHVVSWTADGAVVVPVAGAIDIRIPFKMPVGSQFTQANVYVFTGTGSSTLTLKLMKRTGAAFGTASQVGATHTMTGVSTGQHALAVASFTETPDDTTWYWLVVTSTDTTGAGTIDTATITWTDPGPRCSVG